MARRRGPVATEGGDGAWHIWVTVGTKPNGRPDQRHVKRATKAAAEARADELLDQVKAGAAVKPGRALTVQQWLTIYLDTVAPRKIDPSTVYLYRSKLRNHVYPVIGTIRLDKLQPEHLDAVYLSMQRNGKADATMLQTHRILSRALEIAFRRGLAPRNVAKLIDPPTAKVIEVEPLPLEAAVKVLDATAGRRNRARWSVGLAQGLRQGEALGLRWPYVDLDEATMNVWWQLSRRAFEHGCEPACGRRRGGNCPQRWLPLRTGEIVVEGGLILKEPKGKSKRTVAIPPELVKELRAHREVQALEKQWAGGAWTEHDLVFARPDGGPIDPSSDWDEWKALLALAGVADYRVHDGRHTAATLMLAQGVQERVVQEILGHSSITLTQRYTHVASKMAQDAAAKMGAALLRREGTP
jgi:integrase